VSAKTRRDLTVSPREFTIAVAVVLSACSSFVNQRVDAIGGDLVPVILARSLARVRERLFTPRARRAFENCLPIAKACCAGKRYRDTGPLAPIHRGMHGARVSSYREPLSHDKSPTAAGGARCRSFTRRHFLSLTSSRLSS